MHEILIVFFQKNFFWKDIYTEKVFLLNAINTYFMYKMFFSSKSRYLILFYKNSVSLCLLIYKKIYFLIYELKEAEYQ